MSSYTLGQRIKELRMKMGLNQVELAQGICTPSMISQIESERARPSYKILHKIAERLEVPLEKLLDRIEMNLEYISTYKMAKAMVAAKEYASAIPLLNEVLESPRAVISKVAVQYDLAVCYMTTGELSEAELLFNEAQESAIHRQDIHMIAQTYQSLGEIALERKQYQLAIHLLLKAMAEVEKLELVDVYLKAGILIQIGVAHENLGRLQDSIHYYAQSSSVFESLGNLDDIAKVYLKLGQSYKRLNDLEKANEYSERAISIFEGIENVFLGVKVQVHTANVYGQTGRESDAIQMFEKAIQKLQELGKTEDVGTTYVLLANVQLGVGDLIEAEVSCQIARSFLPEMHIYQARVNRILGQIELKRENMEEAIRRFQMAADCFKSHGKIGEWAETMADVSQLKFESNDTESAFRIIHEVRSQTQQVLSERGIVL